MDGDGHIFDKDYQKRVVYVTDSANATFRCPYCKKMNLPVDAHQRRPRSAEPGAVDHEEIPEGGADGCVFRGVDGGVERGT